MLKKLSIALSLGAVVTLSACQGYGPNDENALGMTNCQTGAAIGAIAGGYLGREVTRKSSVGRQNTATIGGAALGAVAGCALADQ